MDLVADLPVASLPGPPPIPLAGRVPNVLGFFRDPVGRLTDRGGAPILKAPLIARAVRAQQQWERSPAAS